MWIYVKRVQYLDIPTENKHNKAPLSRLLFEMHHNTTLNTNPLNTVGWCLPCYLLPVACMHFQQSFLTALLPHLSPIPFNLHAFAYSSLSGIPITTLWGVHFTRFAVISIYALILHSIFQYLHSPLFFPPS